MFQGRATVLPRTYSHNAMAIGSSKHFMNAPDDEFTEASARVHIRY